MNERQMPKKGDIFEGKINDLSQYDAAKWRRRDIWFFKRELNRGEIFDYPSARDAIILIDTESKHYK